MTSRKNDKIVENVVVEEEIQFRGRTIKREKIIKKWNIPKIINSDIGFQLMFGFDTPQRPSKSEAVIKEITINRKI